jgi:hypothetical protein
LNTDSFSHSEDRKPMDSESIIKTLQSVTRKWTKQKKAEEKDAGRQAYRRQVFVPSYRFTIKDAASEVMRKAYLEASSGGSLPAHARQIMYAARGEIQDRTGEPLDDRYFTQTLLPDYLKRNPTETANWDVVFDARGHFQEPHTGLIVPLGTLDVRHYLVNIDAPRTAKTKKPRSAYPTSGPTHRFCAILFIEKEGFLPLFKAVHLAERYDIAIMSTKGLSVTASRRLVEFLGSSFQVPLLIVRDFDKSGFSIAGTLQRDTRRYQFTKSFPVVDLGLRLTDVEKWHLPSEAVTYRSSPKGNLRDNGATDEENEFLCSEEMTEYGSYRGDGKRVELNAFNSKNLITWLEEKLHEHGIRKVIPEQATLERAYRRAVAAQMIRAQLEELKSNALASASRLPVPPLLKAEVRQRLETNPELSWDEVIGEIAEEEREGGASLS